MSSDQHTNLTKKLETPASTFLKRGTLLKIFRNIKSSITENNIHQPS